VKATLSDVLTLLQNYADVHRALQMPAYNTLMDASTYIRALCQSIKRARLDQRGIELVLAETPLLLHSEQCWKLGMIVAELITNTTRHAFSDHGGSIRIELSSFGLVAQCSFMDNGSSNHSFTPGQGLNIIESLANGLNGKIVHRFGIQGATSVLTFPMPGETLETAHLRQADANEPIALDKERAVAK
jgi:two-component sensor histidine kinase